MATEQATEQTGCTSHTDLAGEFRELGRSALDRLEPWLEQVRVRANTGTGVDADAEADAVPAACAICPICAVIALIRGERSELAVRLSEQASGLLTVLRTALDEGSTAPTAEGEPAGTQPGSGPRDVQHITVVRSDRPPAGC